MISDVLFEAEVDIKEYLANGCYGESDNPVRRAIEHLSAHMKAVRWLPGLDQMPLQPQLDSELEKRRLAGIAKSFGVSSEDARKEYHAGALDV